MNEGEVAKQIIADWKSNPEIREKYNHDFGQYALEEEIRRGWEDPNIRAEFGDDFDQFFYFKKYEHRSK